MISLQDLSRPSGREILCKPNAMMLTSMAEAPPKLSKSSKKYGNEIEVEAGSAGLMPITRIYLITMRSTKISLEINKLAVCEL